MGIEPTSEAWEASILPLYDARSIAFDSTQSYSADATASLTKTEDPVRLVALANRHSHKRKFAQPVGYFPFPFDLPESMKVSTDFLTIQVQPYMNGAF